MYRDVNQRIEDAATGPYKLDMVVHHAAQTMAHKINTDCRQAQLNFLIVQCGMSLEQVLEQLASPDE